jgi:hypothetical protein
MSSGNITTEYTRRERQIEAGILREASLVSNAVLRRALAIAAFEYVHLVGDRGDPDAGVGLMIAWVMRASDEVERGAADGRAMRAHAFEMNTRSRETV